MLNLEWNTVVLGKSILWVKDPLSLTVMLCALFVVKRGHWPEFMASDLGEEMDTETEISWDIRNLLPREGSVNAYGFHLGEMRARFPYNPIHLLCMQFFV